MIVFHSFYLFKKKTQTIDTNGLDDLNRNGDKMYEYCRQYSKSVNRFQIRYYTDILPV